MEHSSPLAAMQPPSMMFGHCFRTDGPTSYSSLSGFGSNNFNFKDLSMKKAGPDYFNVKPMPSPTASLAADLSQNFHIDQSPQLATPRRSLFTSNILSQANAQDNVMTTPPLPPSSPAPAMDMMEMSPLPHKPAFVVTREIDLPSPSPVGSPMDSPIASAAVSPLPGSPLDSSARGHFERRRPGLLRPSLAKSKAQSFQLGMSRPANESRAPPFRFSTAGAKTSLSTSTSLEDMFGDSPPQERTISRNSSSSSLAPPRLRPPFQHARSSGSPASGCIRKASHPTMRPRKQCRRSLSMFEHPADVIADKEAKVTTNAPLPSISDMDSSPTPQLPHFVPEDQADNLPRIGKNTLLELLDGKFNDRFDNIMIVDCRFEYEYEGGHINGAINYNDKEKLATDLFASPRDRTALVLHCEYSAHRAPIMAKYIRHHDRAVNIDSYPNLTYPDLYILDGGYSSFFAEHRSLCFPQNYVEMNADGHEFACERGLGKVKQRSKLHRAQTFAFGQQSSPQMEDSPTGRPRLDRSSRLLASPLGSPYAHSPVSNRSIGRRMLSY
ncbi:hypothetical protein PDE_06982 [Penicillium oxalicum 114-2]|uniref:M-phase inducer phosphatase n=1 Tax=Penicillium oxalicum (strain 114-2 / CGMCC 5302) TaxID=933388 RepID=S8AZY2_PENO1|nr:hypothetical protein PDE_06982 [Penicillium oxalicum 114-2]